MIVGFCGPIGSGKSLSMSAFAAELTKQTKIPLFANYPLIGAKTLTRYKDIIQLELAIMCVDETHKTIDSRAWKNNIEFSHWLLETRHKGILFCWASQHPGQVDLRLRNNTDFMIVCNRDRHTGKISMSVMDWLYKRLLTTMSIKDPTIYYNLYNSYGKIEALT